MEIFESSVGLAIARIVLGALFLLHGLDKFDVGLSNVGNQFAEWGVPAASTSSLDHAVKLESSETN